jgi:hypothetical protein
MWIALDILNREYVFQAHLFYKSIFLGRSFVVVGRNCHAEHTLLKFSNATLNDAKYGRDII